MNITKLIENMGITPKDLAEMVGVTVSTVNRWIESPSTISKKNEAKLFDISYRHRKSKRTRRANSQYVGY